MDPESSDPLFNSDFSNLDAAPRPADLVAQQDRFNAKPSVRAYKRASYAQLGLSPGARVLDVGCGTGNDVRALGELVGPTGHVTGIDLSATMISEARTRCAGLNLPVDFQVGDIRSLAFPDATFEAARTDRVLHHLDDPGRAIDELTRVVRSGGRVVVSEPDFDTLVIDHPDRALTRRILQIFADTGARNASIGRHLYTMFVDRGFRDITVEPFLVLMDNFAQAQDAMWLRETLAKAQATGVISLDEAGAWWADLAAADQAGRFFAAGFGFTVAGSRP